MPTRRKKWKGNPDRTSFFPYLKRPLRALFYFVPMEMVSLHIYPVKGMAGMTVQEAIPEGRGFRYDRRWMMVDPTGRFISQREHPSLATWQSVVEGDHLCINHRHHPEIRLEIGLDHWGQHPFVPVQIWKDTVLAQSSSTSVDAWLQKHLDLSCRLVYMGENSRRPVDPNYALNGEEVSFADGYPYLLTTTASLEDLSRRMESDLVMQRFRPSIVLRTTTPYEEDNWKGLQIGSHRFRITKPCARCQVITIDPETTSVEPRVLTTLSNYRRVGNNVMFGMNACWEGGNGTLSLDQKPQILV